MYYTALVRCADSASPVCADTT